MGLLCLCLSPEFGFTLGWKTATAAYFKTFCLIWFNIMFESKLFVSPGGSVVTTMSTNRMSCLFYRQCPLRLSHLPIEVCIVGNQMTLNTLRRFVFIIQFNFRHHIMVRCYGLVSGKMTFLWTDFLLNI